jgi:chemotaxis protein CheX
MDVRYINPFIKSVCNTFQTMCKLKVHVGQPALKTADDPLTDVSGVIGFSGDAAGSVVLHFAFDTASRIATAFAGTDIHPEHPDFADAIGELANMVAGGAKCQFEGLNINISLPNVIVGRNHNVTASRNTPRILIPCSSDVGVFHVEVGMVLGKPGDTRANQVVTAGANP